MTDLLTTFITSAGLYGPLYYIFSFVMAALLPFIPTPLIGALGGTAFGFLPAVGYGVIGLGIGALTALSLARLVGRPLLLRLVRPEAWKQWEELLGIRSVFVWGLLFFVLNLDFAVAAAGLSALPIGQLWLAAMVARLPWLVASAWFGETFLQSDALLVMSLALVLPLAFLLGRARPRLQRLFVALSERGTERPGVPVARPVARPVPQPATHTVSPPNPKRDEGD